MVDNFACRNQESVPQEGFLMYTIIVEDKDDERREHLKLVGLFEREDDALEYVDDNYDEDKNYGEYWTVTMIYDM